MEVVPCVVTERSTSAKGVSVRSMQTCQWNCPAVGWRKSWTNGWNSERNTLYRIRESENRTNVVEFVVGNNFRVEKAAEKHERKRRINRVMEYILDSTRLGSIPRRIIPVIPDVRRGTKWQPRKSRPYPRYVTRIMATYQVGGKSCRYNGRGRKLTKRDLGKKGLLARLLLLLRLSLPSSSLRWVCACNRPGAHHSLFNWSRTERCECLGCGLKAAAAARARCSIRN